MTEHHEDCGELTTFGTHYHVMIWTPRNFSDITLGRRLRKVGVNKSTYVCERTKNELAMMMYITHPPREIVMKSLTNRTPFFFYSSAITSIVTMSFFPISESYIRKNPGVFLTRF